jgi:iron-sulfur cluster repair protein YtfE (RIC family)
MAKARTLYASMLLCFAFCLSSNVYADTKAMAADNQAAEKKTSAMDYEKQIDAVIARYEAFQIVTEQNTGFKKQWLTRTRLTSVLKPKTAGTENFVTSLGIELMMDEIEPHLLRSSDKAAISYFQSFLEIIKIGIDNEVVCRTFIKAADDAPVSDEDNAKVEASIGLDIYNRMLNSMAEVLVSAKDAEEKPLSEKRNEALMIELVGIMMEKGGPEAVRALGSFSDKNTPPMEKCKTMALMFESVGEMKEEDQADLVRDLLGKSD